MELCAHHLGTEPDTHHGALEMHVRPEFFHTKNVRSHGPQPVVVGVDHLVTPEIGDVERIRELIEQGFFLAPVRFVHRKSAERHFVALRHFADAEMMAGHLKGVTDKKHVLFGVIAEVPLPELTDQVEKRLLPLPARLQRITRPARKNINVVGKIGDVAFGTHVETFEFEHVGISTQDVLEHRNPAI